MRLMSEWCLEQQKKCAPKDKGAYQELYRYWKEVEARGTESSEDKVKKFLVE